MGHGEVEVLLYHPLEGCLGGQVGPGEVGVGVEVEPTLEELDDEVGIGDHLAIELNPGQLALARGELHSLGHLVGDLGHAEVGLQLQAKRRHVRGVGRTGEHVEDHHPFLQRGRGAGAGAGAGVGAGAGGGMRRDVSVKEVED